MLVQSGAPSARRAVHMVFSGEKVRPEYSQTVPELQEGRKLRGVRLVPLDAIVRMKLTSFRLKDQTHLRDLLDAGLITEELDQSLPPDLRERLAYVRTSE